MSCHLTRTTAETHRLIEVRTRTPVLRTALPSGAALIHLLAFVQVADNALIPGSSCSLPDSLCTFYVITSASF